MLEKKLNIAIVGSGPSGFYCAEHLLKIQKDACIDIFEKLPFPYGLVRYGVAPDHQSIKNVEKLFEKIASHANVRFFGNVRVGQDIPLNTLKEFYHAIIFATGASNDKKLGIAGEQLNGIYSATDFVAWYNGHPEFAGKEFNLHAETVAVIGQGNVALDVCRILLKNIHELETTDISDQAIQGLRQSRVRKVYLIGRRGPVQAAFTEHELKEISHLEGVTVRLSPGDFNLNPVSEAELHDDHHKKEQKNWHIFQEILNQESKAEPGAKILDIRFFMSPLEFLGEKGTLKGGLFGINELSGEPFCQKVVPTGRKESLAFDLCFESIGYFGNALEGVPFDQKKGVIPNDHGVVIIEGEENIRLYTAGWIKRGPQGVIGTNRTCSHETVDRLLLHTDALLSLEVKPCEEINLWMQRRGIRYVNFDDWKKLDAHEISTGQALGKVRQKITRISDALDLI